MYADLHARLATLAEEDNDREERLGRAEPLRMTIYLVGGHVIEDCALSDGLNGLDDQSIDVTTPADDFQSWWIVPLAHIVAIHARYPKEETPAPEGGA
jgi:hypothetical protein